MNSSTESSDSDDSSTSSSSSRASSTRRTHDQSTGKRFQPIAATSSGAPERQHSETGSENGDYFGCLSDDLELSEDSSSDSSSSSSSNGGKVEVASQHSDQSFSMEIHEDNFNLTLLEKEDVVIIFSKEAAAAAAATSGGGVSSDAKAKRFRFESSSELLSEEEGDDSDPGSSDLEGSVGSDTSGSESSSSPELDVEAVKAQHLLETKYFILAFIDFLHGEAMQVGTQKRKDIKAAVISLIGAFHINSETITAFESHRWTKLFDLFQFHLEEMEVDTPMKSRLLRSIFKKTIELCQSGDIIETFQWISCLKMIFAIKGIATYYMIKATVNELAGNLGQALQDIATTIKIYQEGPRLKPKFVRTARQLEEKLRREYAEIEGREAPRLKKVITTIINTGSPNGGVRRSSTEDAEPAEELDNQKRMVLAFLYYLADYQCANTTQFNKILASVNYLCRAFDLETRQIGHPLHFYMQKMDLRDLFETHYRMNTEAKLADSSYNLFKYFLRQARQESTTPRRAKQLLNLLMDRFRDDGDLFYWRAYVHYGQGNHLAALSDVDTALNLGANITSTDLLELKDLAETPDKGRYHTTMERKYRKLKRRIEHHIEMVVMREERRVEVEPDQDQGHAKRQRVD